MNAAGKAVRTVHEGNDRQWTDSFLQQLHWPAHVGTSQSVAFCDSDRRLCDRCIKLFLRTFRPVMEHDRQKVCADPLIGFITSLIIGMVKSRRISCGEGM
jgi:hypothetical protein